MKRIRGCFSLLFFLALCLAFAQKQCVAQQAFTLVEDVPFLEAGGIPLKLDIFVPEGAGPFPMVVAVHGGGFVRGDKGDIHSKCRAFADAGYVVFDANYRTLSVGASYPDFVKDIHTAVKWAKAHAGEYKADPDRAALTGFSAGAYIASIVAVTSQVKKLQHADTEFEGVTSEVQAVISFYGHQDLTILDPVQRETARFIFGGARFTKQDAAEASPASYLDHAAPTLMFHNEVDHLVPVEQSRAMYAHLKGAGAPVYFYEFPEKAHDLLNDDEQWALGVAVKFLDKYLKAQSNIELPDSIPSR